MLLETEIKISIAPSALPKMKQSLGQASAVLHQRNVYMDTADGFLRKRKEMLRLRFQSPGDQAILCFKGRSVQENGLFQAPEHEWKITQDEAKAFLDRPETQVDHLSDVVPSHILAQLSVLGALRTTRTTFDVDEGLVLELDEVLFPDGSLEAEIEIEFPAERPELAETIRTFIDQLLEQSAVEGAPQTESKFVRFLRNTGQLL